MILVFDIGNTETTVGLFDGDELRAQWRLTTNVARTADELGLVLRALTDAAAVPAGAVTGAAIGSVVPAVTPPLLEACRRYFGVSPVVVDATAPLPIRLDVDEPLTVGADRLINTLAASRLFGCDTIVVDLGTANTFDCITADGVFLGGIIAPGIQTSADMLFRRTSKLPATELVAPERVIGRRTEECIRAGVVYGAADSIDGLVRRIKRVWPGGGTPLVVATGGLAELFHAHCEELDRVEPHLTLRGLQIAHALLTTAPGAVRQNG
jgi:type III pantothenate kinase